MTFDSRLEELIDRISEMVVLTELSDQQGLAFLIEGIREVGDLLAQHGQTVPAAAAAAAAEKVKGILFEEEPDPPAAAGIVGRAIGALQGIVRHGADPATTVFPDELGLSARAGPDVEESAAAAEGEPDGQAAAVSPAPGAEETAALTPPTDRLPDAIHLPPSMPRLPPGVDTDILEMFLDQQDTVLEEMDDRILSFEKTHAREDLAALLRLLHTMKGEAGVLGLDSIAQVCHATEDYLETDADRISPDKLFAVKDWLAGTFGVFKGERKLFQSPASVMAELGPPAAAGAPGEKQTIAEPVDAGPAAGAGVPIAETEIPLIQDFISDAKEHFELADDNLLILERDPSDEEALNTVFRCFHTLKGVSSFLNLPDITKLAHGAESLLDAVRKGRVHLTGSTTDVVFRALDAMKNLVDRLGNALAQDAPIPPDPALPALLEEMRSILGPGAGTQAVSKPRRTQRRRAARAAETPATPAPADMHEPEPAVSLPHLQLQESVKIDVPRLDRLIDTIGELVIAQSIVARDPDVRALESERLENSLAHLGKTVRMLQEMSMSIRMSPIKPLFHKMARMVRDLAKRENKQIDFAMSGEDTELDRGMLEKISDPLVHMLRNSVDHGIEDSPAARRRAGKPAAGRIELKAFHKGGNIHIEIADDGRGLNRDAIIRKGIERGVIQSGQHLSDDEAYALIFEPGFSTADRITDISGRGVGMDVVLRNIESLHGQILINSAVGSGTTFTLVFPLTLAIIDGMVVRVGIETYVVPVLSIVEAVRPSRDMLSTVTREGEMLSARGAMMPVFRLARLFGVRNARQDPTDSILIIVEDAGRQAVLMVDELLEEQQIVIKSLGDGLGSITGISGSCIMPDGTVALIVDVPGIIRLATQ
ncbi:MAG: Hpt domain-containing protein [Kiritimatiellae bacterium]|nr:Hpt domain-containing protein [Kiritimatiellia bacterium]